MSVVSDILEFIWQKWAQLSQWARIVFVVVLCLVVCLSGLAAYARWGDGISFESDPIAARLGGAPQYQDNNLRGCLTTGKKLTKEYVIQAATMIIRIDDDLQSQMRESHFRTIYTLRGLTGEAHFTEAYDAGVEKSPVIKHWPGSEPETIGYQNYGLQFTLAKGETRTVITGEDFNYKADAQREPALGSISLAANQDFYSYRNGEDVVCELTIVIESSSRPIHPLQNQQSAIRVDERGTPRRSDVHFVSYDDSSGRRNSISARWSMLMPHENAGIFFQW